MKVFKNGDEMLTQAAEQLFAARGLVDNVRRLGQEDAAVRGDFRIQDGLAECGLSLGRAENAVSTAMRSEEHGDCRLARQMSTTALVLARTLSGLLCQARTPAGYYSEGRTAYRNASRNLKAAIELWETRISKTFANSEEYDDSDEELIGGCESCAAAQEQLLEAELALERGLHLLKQVWLGEHPRVDLRRAMFTSQALARAALDATTVAANAISQSRFAPESS